MSTSRGEMRTLMGLLVVLMVSGEDMEDVEGFLGESVILPCSCLNRNLEMEFKWQMGQKPAVVKYNGTTPYFHNNYTGRVELLLSENSSSCSIRLTNITAADQGIYRCIFHYKEQYRYEWVNLSVSERKVPIMLEVIDTRAPDPEPTRSPENTRKYLGVMPIAVVVLLLSLFLLYNWKVSRRQKRENRETTEKTEKEELTPPV